MDGVSWASFQLSFIVIILELPKLCHIVYDEFPHDSRVRRYTNLLVQSGVETFVVCAGRASSNYEPENAGIVKVYRLPMRKRRSSFGRRLFEYLTFEVYAFAMASYLFFRHRVKVFHIHNLPDFLVFSCVIPKLFGARVILDFHELFPEFMMQQAPALNADSIPIKILRFQERLAVRFADEVITIHEPARDILYRRNQGNTLKDIHIIMNAVDPGEIQEVVRSPSSNFSVFFAGTMNYSLNLELLVEAISKVRELDLSLYESMHLHLYGDGPALKGVLEKAVNLKVANTISYHGKVSYAETIKAACKASVCVIPAEKNIYSDLYYSLKLVEMIYIGVPVIAPRLMTYQYYYPESAILYYEPGNAGDLADKIIYAANNPDQMRERAKEALRAYEPYSWAVMSQRYRDVLSGLFRDQK